MKRRSGFTLVELLIVLAVIAALLATLTPVAVNAVNRANATRIASDMRAIGEAARSYVAVELRTDVEAFLKLSSTADVIKELKESGYLDGEFAEFEVSISSTDGVHRVTVSRTVANNTIRSFIDEIVKGAISGTSVSITRDLLRSW